MDKYEHWLGRLFGKINGKENYAVTFGQVSYYSVPKEKVGLGWRVHEDTHKKQYKEDGWIWFLTRYIFQLIVHGYQDIDYEVEARNQAELAVKESSGLA